MKDKKKSSDELRPEYDFDYSKAVRGKYYRRLLAEGSNVVILDPDISMAKTLISAGETQKDGLVLTTLPVHSSMITRKKNVSLVSVSHCLALLNRFVIDSSVIR